jgi:hypothetical protein
MPCFFMFLHWDLCMCVSFYWSFQFRLPLIRDTSNIIYDWVVAKLFYILLSLDCKCVAEYSNTQLQFSRCLVSPSTPHRERKLRC